MGFERDSLPDEYVLTGAQIVDPEAGAIAPGEIWVRDGKLAEARPGGACGAGTDVPRIDLGGLHVAPGFVDVHVHFREPGHEYKEDIETGCRAAVAGGFTSVVMMPNTEPPFDSASVLEAVLRRGREVGLCDVHAAGTLTAGRAGQKLAEYHDLKTAGAVTLSDDGAPVADTALMRRALEHAAMLGLVVTAHSENLALSAGGSMHEGYWSTHLGITGIPAAAEELGVARDLILARETGAPIHIQHVSTRGAVDLVRLAKRDWELDVTAETAPHYLELTDRELVGYSANFKMNPPLRTEADRQAVVAAFADGTLDMLATDHAPHAEMEKELEIDRAPFGVIGLETAFAVAHTQCVVGGAMSLLDLVRRMTLVPAQRFGLGSGGLAAGAPANLAVFDPAARWQVEARLLRSRSRNSPFLGRALRGRVVATIHRGRLVQRLASETRAAVHAA